MTPEERKEYMREYRKQNRAKLNEQRRVWESTPERKAEKAQRDREYRERNADDLSARRAAYREQNRERIRERARSYYKEKPEIFVLHNIRTRARAQGVPCTITAEDIASATPEFCPVLGIKLERAANPKGGVADNTPTVDRLIPHLGYVRGNIIVVSHKANRIKNNATIEELESVTHFYKSLFQVMKIGAEIGT